LKFQAVPSWTFFWVTGEMSVVVPTILGWISGPLEASAAPDSLTEVPQWKSCLLQVFTQPPGALAFMVDVLFFYMRNLLNIVVAIQAVVSQRHSLALTLMFGVVCPGLMHSVNMYYIMLVISPDVSVRTRFFEATLAAFNLNRGVEARRYLKGKAPTMGLVIKDKLGNLTFGAVPAISASLQELMKGTVQPGTDRKLLIFQACMGTLAAGFSMKLLHTISGPPSRMEKYRFWDVDSRPVLHISMVQLIDMSQIVYRITLFALVGAFVGVELEIAMVLGYAAVSSCFFKMGLSLMPAYDNSSNLMSLISGLENAVYDYAWLERVPVYSFYAEASFHLRMIQMGIAAGIIYANWENHVDFDHTVLWMTLGVCVFFATTYVVTYVHYVFYLMRHRVAMSGELRDEFVGNMFLKRQQRRQDRRAVLLE